MAIYFPQAICTIVANRVNPKDKAMKARWAQAEKEMGPGGASAKARGGTLVVCPTIALKQWQSELARFVKPGTLKVVIHHGAKRALLADVSVGHCCVFAEEMEAYMDLRHSWTRVIQVVAVDLSSVLLVCAT